MASPAAPLALLPQPWGCSSIQLPSPCRRQLESSSGENTISIIGTARLYQPSWQQGNIFCFNPHRGQIVSSCSSLPRIPWEPAKGYILQSFFAGTQGKERHAWASGDAQNQAVRFSFPLTHLTTHRVLTSDLGKLFCWDFSRLGVTRTRTCRGKLFFYRCEPFQGSLKS